MEVYSIFGCFFFVMIDCSTLGELAVQFCCFLLTKTLPLRKKLSVPSDFNNEISFLSIETFFWLIKSSAGKKSNFTKRSLDLSIFFLV